MKDLYFILLVTFVAFLGTGFLVLGMPRLSGVSIAWAFDAGIICYGITIAISILGGIGLKND